MNNKCLHFREKRLSLYQSGIHTTLQIEKKIAYLISCMKVRLQYFIARVTSANPQQMCIFLYISAIMVEFFRRVQTNSMLTELCKLFI